jgi:hypothetical protein
VLVTKLNVRSGTKATIVESTSIRRPMNRLTSRAVDPSPTGSGEVRRPEIEVFDHVVFFETSANTAKTSAGARSIRVVIVTVAILS